MVIIKKEVTSRTYSEFTSTIVSFLLFPLPMLLIWKGRVVVSAIVSATNGLEG